VFRKTVEQLQLQKERLVAQSEANRSALIADWRRLQSPDPWLNEAGDFFRRHPMWMATLATAAGTLGFKIFRRPRTFLGRIGRLGRLASVAISAWKLFNRRKSKS
jgi:hypothetical protein